MTPPIKIELLTYLYERVSMQLENTPDSGILIADQPPGDRTDEKKWLADTIKITENGSRYIRPNINRIALPVLTTRSDHVDLLQLADLVTAATTALIAGSQYAEPYRDLLYTILAKNSYNYTSGTGLKLVPDMVENPNCLLNLPYWVFGEEAYTRANTGIPLPWACSGWSYSVDDGLGNTVPQIVEQLKTRM